ncbi:MAG TPA: M48 family metalloprotease [Flavobacteriales bacterium]|nr:M48 family metalloprotease [Flavobacteriales bacterium]
MQLKTKAQQNKTIKKQNNTGMPDNLKSGIENLSGHSMDDVKANHTIVRQTGTGTVQRVEKGVVQLEGDPLTEAEREKAVKIVRGMGINPDRIVLRSWIKPESQCIGNTIYISKTLFVGNEDELRFVLGHELSHYITMDNSNFGLSTAMTGMLGGLVHYFNPGWFGGILGSIGAGAVSLLSGAGFVNAFVHAVSAGSTVIMVRLLSAIGYGYLANPLAMALAVVALTALPKILSNLTKSESIKGYIKLLTIFSPETLIQLIIETKADIHAAIKLGAAREGVKHFESEMKDNRTEAFGLTKGNALIDPWHPPLSVRVSYLKKLAGL